MKKIVVDAGVCGETVEATAESRDGRHVKINITKCCRHIVQMKGIFNNGPLDGYALMRNIEKSEIHIAADKCLPHVTCPVPTALHKLVEAELGLAVPVDVSIRFEKE